MDGYNPVLNGGSSREFEDFGTIGEGLFKVNQMIIDAFIGTYPNKEALIDSFERANAMGEYYNLMKSIYDFCLDASKNEFNSQNETEFLITKWSEHRGFLMRVIKSLSNTQDLRNENLESRSYIVVTIIKALVECNIQKSDEAIYRMIFTHYYYSYFQEIQINEDNSIEAMSSYLQKKCSLSDFEDMLLKSSENDQIEHLKNLILMTKGESNNPKVRLKEFVQEMFL